MDLDDYARETGITWPQDDPDGLLRESLERARDAHETLRGRRTLGYAALPIRPPRWPDPIVFGPPRDDWH